MVRRVENKRQQSKLKELSDREKVVAEGEKRNEEVNKEVISKKRKYERKQTDLDDRSEMVIGGRFISIMRFVENTTNGRMGTLRCGCITVARVGP